MDYELSTRYVVGVDVGQASDPTAVCVVEAAKWRLYRNDEARLRRPNGVPRPGYVEAMAEMPKPEYRVRHLERLQLGMPYPLQAAYLVNLIGRIPGASCLLDATGVGRPVSDLFRELGLRHTPVLITAGREVTRKGEFVGVPKLELISRLQASLHAGELKIAAKIPDAAALVRELQEFRASWTESGNLMFNARQGAHDDLVIAAALAVWGSTRSDGPPWDDLSGDKLKRIFSTTFGGTADLNT
jgi:hypothetical protein